MISPLSTSVISLPHVDLVSRAAIEKAPRLPGQPNSNPEGSEEARSRQPVPQISLDGLSPQERRLAAELSRIDRQVRAHEQAHLAAGAGVVRGVSYTFTTGPDGKQYAVGGEVRIDTSPVGGNPAATVRKAQQIQAAANAPANPSQQDRAVAAQASQMEQAARFELAQQRREGLRQQNRAAQLASFEQASSSEVGNLLSSLA